jgi:aspartate carbamoyltransferase regulatory subunit
MNSETREYKVTALRQGTVIDHLPPRMALKVLEVLGIEENRIVTVGVNLDSKKWGRKDIVKIEGKELTEQEIAKIALLGNHTTISIIRDYQVVGKLPVLLPSEIRGVVRCPNPSCITNHDPVRTRFKMEQEEPLKVRCFYCERVVSKEELELL